MAHPYVQLKNRPNSRQQQILDFLKSYRSPESGQCTPTMQEIADAVGISRVHARQLTSDLAKEGFIEKVQGYDYVDCDPQENYASEQRFTTDFAIAKRSSWNLWRKGPNLYRVLCLLILLTVGHSNAGASSSKDEGSSSYATSWRIWWRRRQQLQGAC